MNPQPSTIPVRLPVILSQGQSQNPAKRKLEEDLAAALRQRDDVQVLVVPHLYDLPPQGQVLSKLRAITGDLVVLAWLYERATHWILDRNGIRGHVGESELRNTDDDEDFDDEYESGDGQSAEGNGESAEEKVRVIASRDVPDRTIYCFDLRLRTTPDDFVAEIARLAESYRADQAAASRATDPTGTPSVETVTNDEDRSQAADATSHSAGSEAGHPLLQWIQGTPRPEQLDRYLNSDAPPTYAELQEEANRRWYPVIDYSRCTNCLECIDFCLFGVYGIDGQETILVEQPDNCRKGCPACSRVCPENAIIFPQHKTPTIAGSPSTGGGLKIDLSQLFGAPDAVEVAARERDEQLLLAGREAVGLTVGIPKRQAHKPAQAPDELDALLDQLDEIDL